MSNLQLNRETRVLSYQRKDHKQSCFPFVWMRDNCQCENCFHLQSQARKINCETFDVNAEPIEAKFVEKGLQVIWNDNHQSTYALEWLQRRDFAEDVRAEYLVKSYRPEKKIWSKNQFNEIFKTFDFHKILESDEELLNWIKALSINGIALIKNAPHSEFEVRKVIDRVGFIKHTQFGDEFILKTKDGATNYAYVGTTLQMHTDLPYYDYKPGTNLLHCLVQSNSGGGQNTIADGFYAANKLKKLHPEHYEVLSRVLVNWRDAGTERTNHYDLVLRSPVICLDQFGKIYRINHSVTQRDSFFTVPVHDAQLWYNALSKFVQLIHEESVEFRSEPGDILTFDNIRCIHGRKGFEDTKDNMRHLVGAYLDWDGIYSRWRVLNV